MQVKLAPQDPKRSREVKVKILMLPGTGLLRDGQCFWARVVFFRPAVLAPWVETAGCSGLSGVVRAACLDVGLEKGLLRSA